MTIERRHLETLLAIRQTGSMQKAAEELGLTQSAVSHQIKSLEQALGATLLRREARPVTLAEAGDLLADFAARTLPEFHALEQRIRELGEGRSGRLRIGVECHTCYEWLLQIMDAYRRDWPSVEVDIAAEHKFAALPALIAGELDLVIACDPVAHRGVGLAPLFKYEVVLAVPSESPLASKPFVVAGDLADQTVITYPVDPSRLDLFTELLWPAGVAPLAHRKVEMTSVMLQLVAHGRGVAAIPTWILETLPSGASVATVPIGKKGLWKTLYAAVRESDAKTPFVRAFARTASEQSLAAFERVKKATRV